MNFILWIFFGGVAGLVASWILGSHLGIIETIIIGMVGSVIGGGIANLFHLGRTRRFSFIDFFFSVIGAVLLLYIIIRFF